MTIDELKRLYDNDHLDECITAAEKTAACASLSAEERSEAYFILGNAHRRMANWRLALNSYSEAMELNPASPAKDAYDSVMEILEFYNHDLYNP